jgi:hypothetical protein
VHVSIAADLPTWLARGDALKCFPSRIAQARYANAWEEGEIDLVAPQLERIFTRVHKLPAVNWLAVPETVAAIDSSVDAPAKFAEDWTEADFAVALPDGQVVSVSWFSDPESWNVLKVMALEKFLFLQAGEKVRVAREWLTELVDLRTRFPAGAQTLVDAAARADLIASALPSSEALRVLLWDADPGAVAAMAAEFRSRVLALSDVRRAVFDPPDSGPRFLTFSAIRSCKYVFQLDQLLASAQSPATANLITYLRCQNAPANN